MKFALCVAPPVAVVCEVPRGLRGILLSAQHLLSRLNALLGNGEGNVPRFASGVEHRLLKGRLHGGEGVYGEGGRHDAFVSLVLPFVGVAVVEAATAPLR